MIRPSRADAFVGGMAAAFIVPEVLPGVGIDFKYFFVMILVLLAWLTMKWTAVKSLTQRGGVVEIVIGTVAVLSVLAYNYGRQSPLGMLDMVAIFAGMVVSFYGFRAFKLFWVPAAYGVVLLAGYQLQLVVPNFVALQNWMAGVMAASMNAIGVTATVTGQYVQLNSASGPLLLNVEGDCTGVQGILAFGLLSTMSVLDLKVRPARLAILLTVGFVGAFLINIVRLFGVFLSFEFLGVDIGTTVHVYLGYSLFIVWVLVFWSLAFKYLTPRQSPALASVRLPTPPMSSN